MGITCLLQTDDFFNQNSQTNNYINLNSTPSGEVLTYVEVQNLHDGSAMTDSRLDGYVYRKKADKFYRLCFDAKIQKFLEKYTVSEFRGMTLTELYLLELGYYSGVRLHGYYDLGDTPDPVIYTLTETPLSDNGGSSFQILGKVFVHKFLGAVDGLYFGVQIKDKPITIAAFRHWQKYVNDSAGLYFQLTNKGGVNNNEVFALYEPLYIRKSFIGINDPVLMYDVNEVGKTVSPTETSEDGATFNVAAVIGINPKKPSDAGDRLEFRNLKIYCTSADNDYEPAQDYGIYFPQGTSVKLENILVVRPNKAGFKFITLWMSELIRLNSWSSRKYGFELDGTFTSLQMSNCYAHTFKERGFRIRGAHYSTFANLGADSGLDALTAYSIEDVFGCTFQSLGSESCTLDYLFYFANVCSTISNVFCLSNTFKKSVFYGFQGSTMQISNVKLDDCHKSADSPRVNSFEYNNQFENHNDPSIKRLGEKYFITYTDFNDKFTLGSYECPLELPSFGTYTFSIKEKTKSFINGVWKEVVMA